MRQIILALPASYPYGGAQATRFQWMAEGLRRSGWGCRVVGVIAKGSEHRDWQVDELGTKYLNLPVPRWPCSGSDVGDALKSGVRRAYDEQTFDVLIAYGPYWTPIKQCLGYAHERRATAIVDCTEWYAFRPWRLTNAYYRDHVRFRKHLRGSDGAIAVSRYWEQYITAKGVKCFRFPAVCSADVPVKAHASESRPEGATIKVGYFGAPSRRNMVHTMLDAVRIARLAGTPVELNCYGHWAGTAGTGIARRIQRDSVLRDSVRIGGFLPGREAVFDTIRELDAVILLRDNDVTSRACFPTRLVEYMMCGVPAITSRSGDIDEYVADEESAYLVPAGHRPHEVANAMARVASDLPASRRIGLNGAIVARRRFCHITVSRSLSNWLDQFVDADHGVARCGLPESV